MKYIFYLLICFAPFQTIAQNHQRFLFEEPITSSTMDEYGNSYLFYKRFDSYITLVKMDPNNNLVWSRTYYDFLMGLEYAPSPTYITAKNNHVYLGYSNSSIDIRQSGLIQLDTNGNVEWHKRFQIVIPESAPEVPPFIGGVIELISVPDGIISVWTNGKNIRVIKHDTTGVEIFQVGLKHSNPDPYQLIEAMDAVLSQDGNVIVVGRLMPFWFATSVDANSGTVNWFNSYDELPIMEGEYSNGWAKCIEVLGPDRFIIGGKRNFNGVEQERGFFLIMDGDGNLGDMYTFKGNRANEVRRIYLLDDGNLHMEFYLNDTTTSGSGTLACSPGYGSTDPDSFATFYSLVEIGTDDYCLTTVGNPGYRYTEEIYMYLQYKDGTYQYRHKCHFFKSNTIKNNCTDYDPYKLEAMDTVFSFTVNPGYTLVPSLMMSSIFPTLPEYYPDIIVDCQNISGVEENTKIELRIAPNPTSGVMNIASMEDMEYVEFFDMNGTSIRKVQIQGKYVSMDISDFTPGVYLLRAKTINGLGITKVVVQ